MIQKTLFLTLFVYSVLFAALPSYAQIVINEGCSANLNGIIDEDKDASDWIELYNLSRDTLSLNGYFLSDKKSEPQMWKIPDVEILPDSFYLFFASDKNRSKTVNHWETAVYSDSAWKYLNPDYEPHPLWEWPEFVDTSWQTGFGGFGFGDDDDTTRTVDTLRTIYLRKKFIVQDTSKIINALFHIDYDDGFVVYLNGHEIIRENIQPDGKTPHYMQTAMWGKEEVMYQGGVPPVFVINETELKRYLKNGENTLAIQCHNRWDDDDMTIRPWLSFSIIDTSTLFGPVPSWFYAPQIPLHTNFSISSAGEKVYLFSPLGMQLDKLDILHHGLDNSYGRKKDGESALTYFVHPTPGFSNDSLSACDSMIHEVAVIEPSTGFFADSVLVTILSPDTNYVVRYTLDGSTPTMASNTFLTPFYLTNSTAVRARLFQPGAIASKTTTATFFIDENSLLKTVSVITDPDNLWNEDYGIYVKGTQYLPDPPYFGANFWDDIEVPAHVELITPEGSSLLAQDCGLKIHGGWTRYLSLKSIRPMAKGKYGNDYFSYPLFNDKPNLFYKRFVLRNGGNDYYSCYFRDAFIHTLVFHHANVDILDYEPVLVFLNGGYLGIQNMREKIDRYYIESNYGIDPNQVDILEEQGEVIDGDNADFLSLFDFIQHNDLSLDENFSVVSDAVEISSFTDLMAVNIFMVNTDWPHNNMKWWREKTGKWRYFLLDLDASTALFSHNHAGVEQILRVVNDTISANAVFFTKMTKNIPFRDYFINRYADLMNTCFDSLRMQNHVDEFVQRLRPEIARHKSIWGGGSATNWEDYYVNHTLRNFLSARPGYARTYVVDYFDLEKSVDILFRCEPDLSAHMRINTIYPDSLPFRGVYFDPVPIEVEVLPAPGFTFLHWQRSDGSIISAQEILSHVFTSNDTLIAVLTGSPDTASLVITEIQYAAHPEVNSGDWIELYNEEPYSVDISNWSFKINDFFTDKIAQDVAIRPHGYLVIAQDSSLFRAVYDTLVECICVPNLDLKRWNTSISLLDNHRNKIAVARYDTLSPWPENIHASGHTVELIDIALNPELGDSWQQGCLGGSPGTGPRICNDQPKVLFTEYNPNSCDCWDSGDWVELYNADSTAVDLTGWIFRDNDDDHQFAFPEHAVMEPESYVVICRDPVSFYSVNPDVAALGPFDFGLGDSDSLILINRYKNTISSLGYSSDSLWPNDIYGTGRTAELISVDSTLTSPYSWQNGCYGGTPAQSPDSCFNNPDLLISEIQYHPRDDENAGTWFELFNNDSIAVDLSGWTLLNRDSTITLSFPTQMPLLDSSQYMVFVQNPSLFSSQFPDIEPYPYSTGIMFGMSADAIGLQDQFGITRLWFGWDVTSPWPTPTDTTGRTIELKDYLGDRNDPENWMEGCWGGSPGTEHLPCDTTGVQEFSSQWYVYPNPVKDKLTLKLDGNESRIDALIIYSPEGKPVKSWFPTSQEVCSRVVDVSDLKPGVYFLYVKMKFQNQMIRFVVL